MYDDAALTKIDRKRGKSSAFLIEANEFEAVLIQTASTSDTLFSPSSADFIKSLELGCSIEIFGDVHRKKNCLIGTVRRCDNYQS